MSNKNWDPADATGGLAAGDKYLDDSKLYVGVFNEDGTGEWKELSYGINDLDETNPEFEFHNQGDVMIGARLSKSVDTFIGKDAEAVHLKRFFVGPKGCEITGNYLTPDARAQQQSLSRGKTGAK